MISLFNTKYRNGYSLNHLLLIMRLVVFLLCLNMSAIFANVHAQNVTLKAKNISLAKAIRDIQKQSGRSFFISGKNLADLKVNVDIESLSVEQALALLTKDIPVKWTIENETIVLKSAPSKNAGTEAVAEINTKSIQNNGITGRVIDEKNNPIAGATVTSNESNSSTSTNQDGEFALQSSVPIKKVTVSSVGYMTKEINVLNNSPLTVQLLPEITAINDVVVTALGIKRDKKSLGYAVQEVSGQAFEKVKETNIMSSLTGQVAGLTVYNRTGTFDAPVFDIRGSSSILIVIDGIPVGTDTWSINPDDIEKLDVIKGGTGAALYGAQGANGVIMITTKKGAANGRKSSINVNSSAVFNAGFLAIPEYQTKYGQGQSGQYIYGTIQNDLWGPKLNQHDPNTESGFVELVQWNSPIDPVTGQRVPLPWIARNSNPVKEFLKGGYTLNNSVSVGGTHDNGHFRLGYTNIFKQGNVPNTDLKNQTIDFMAGYNLTDKLNVEGKISYNNLASDNYETSSVYSWDNYMLHIMNNLGANIDMNDLKNYWEPGKEGLTQRSWSPNRNNPYWILYENTHGYNRDRFNGWFKAEYKFNSKFNVLARISQIMTQTETENSENKGNIGPANPGGKGAYTNAANKNTDMNMDWLARYQDRLAESKFGFDAVLGGNRRVIKGRALQAGAPSLIVSDYYNLSNKTDFNTASNSNSKKIVNSLYGSLNLDYNNLVFLSVTGRNDWSSALKRPNNSYFYPSTSLSVILSEMIDLPSQISLLKLRSSWAMGRDDMAAFWNDQVYTISSYNGIPLANESATLYSTNLKPSKTENLEFGLDFKFFNNRLEFDAAYFEKLNIERIGVTSISHTSGYTGLRQNGDGIKTRGFEYTVAGTPIKTTDFMWKATLNMSYYKQYVHSLAPGQEYYADYYRVGERIGRIRGREFVFNNNKEVIYVNGLPEVTTVFKPIGDNEYFDPKMVFGFINHFKYKDFSLTANIDGRLGGMLYNYAYANTMLSGAAKETAEGNIREQSFVGKGVKVIGGEVLYDVRGNIVFDTREYAPNDVPVPYETWVKKAYTGNYSVNAFDASHLKVRELSVTYNLPKSWLQNLKIDNANVSLVGRNLLLWTDVKYTDPDIKNSDEAQSPSVRNIGFNINLTF